MQGSKGIKRRNWENFNSIINKIYLKIKYKRYVLPRYCPSAKGSYSDYPQVSIRILTENKY